MARARTVEVGWTHPETEEEFRVTLNVSLPVKAHGWDPGDSGEVEVIEVCEDAPGGASRPDLIDEVEKDLDRIEDRAFEAASEWDGPDTTAEWRGER